MDVLNEIKKMEKLEYLSKSKYRAREGKTLKVLTKKILPLYSSIRAAFLSFLCVGTCKSLSST